MEKGEGYYRKCGIVPLAILTALFIVPLFFTLTRAFFPRGGSFTLSYVKAAFLKGYNYRILLFTLAEASASAIASLLVAFPAAAICSNYDFHGKRLLLSLSELCFVLPSILVVLGFVIFFGNNGFLNRILMRMTGSGEPVLRVLYSFKAIILAHAYLNFPVALSCLTSGWSSLSPGPENAAYTLGSGRIRTFLTITLRRILPFILSAFILVFLFCFTSFSIILVLGGGPEFTTLEVEIYKSNNILLDESRAAAVSIFSLIVNALLLFLHSLCSKAARGGGEKQSRTREKPIRGKGVKAFALIYSLTLLLFILGPLLSIVARSLQAKGGDVTADAYKEIFGIIPSKGQLTNAAGAIASSIIIALSSSTISNFIALKLSLFASKSKGILADVIATAPMAVSSVTLALGYSLLRSSMPVYNDLISLLMIILVHAVITMPFSVRMISPAIRSLPERTLLAAYTLGASEEKASKTVEVPSVRYAIVKAFIFSFAISMGEVNATLVLSEGRISTLPILIYRLIGSYNYRGACALGTMLVLVTLIVFALSEQIEKGRKS